MIMPLSSFDLLREKISTNPLTQKLYQQLWDELTSKSSLPSKRRIALHVATKLVEFTETAYPAISGNIQIRANDKETYAEIGALLIYELHPTESERNSHDAIRELSRQIETIVNGE
ncbi:MAG: hypothetical protein LUF83_00930 [Alistipes sp.]|uniref:hypothetical protein n=1 Tax=Alistipes putredinis TaxID=28117 RepID=UPI0026658BA1|nr:hypothetical protein [Alistipes putredinis]MCD8032851.1 hypothetical protein [Alistipes sp.]